MSITALNRTLDQELLALERGASMECPVCGEFLLRTAAGLHCTECRALFTRAAGAPPAQLELSLGYR
jgi:predicted RNA-binding Zn-ribbon protein involved in translation (DUF1610 family)